MVGEGWAGGISVGEAVAVGKNGSKVGTWIEYSEVGVACSTSGGWKAVGVAEASGAAVINTIESERAGSTAAGIPNPAQAEVNPTNARAGA
jgi:hypothetical protein